MRYENAHWFQKSSIKWILSTFHAACAKGYSTNWYEIVWWNASDSMKWNNNKASNEKSMFSNFNGNTTINSLRNTHNVCNRRWYIDVGNTNKIILILHWDNVTHFTSIKFLAGPFDDFSFSVMVLMGEPKTKKKHDGMKFNEWTELNAHPGKMLCHKNTMFSALSRLSYTWQGKQPI